MLQLDDIQGNVLAGFNTCVEIFVALAVRPGEHAVAARWIASLAGEVTTVADIREQRRAIKAPLDGRQTDLTWLGLAVSASLLKVIRPDLHFHDDACRVGIIKRAKPRLGDFTDPAGWRVGGSTTPVDLFLTIAGNDEVAAVARADALVAAASANGLLTTYRETARRIQDLEHFGFRDGVSQPLVDGYDAGGTHSPGLFVFGYPRFPGGQPYLPADDPGGLLTNGAFLVFRRLLQDVAAFRAFAARKATELATALPGLTHEHLEALIVGRWPSGALVSMDIPTDPGRQPNENAFDFADDPSGRGCPFGAHIRKVNPRAGPKDESEIPRIIRRGVPFGAAFDVDPHEERGLAFVSYQTSIQNQLEFLHADWMNSSLKPGPRAGHDILVGQTGKPRATSLPTSGGAVTLSTDGEEWIRSSGGAYLFAPGRGAIARLADAPAQGVGWRLRRIFRELRHSVAGR